MRALIILLASAFAVSAEWPASENAGRSRSRRLCGDPRLRDCPNKEQHVPWVFDAGEKIDQNTLTPDVQLTADALLVLMQYQNKGYALMTF